jgi:hypothetical protein
LVKHRLHIRARRAKARGSRYEAHGGGLDMCSINFTTAKIMQFCSGQLAIAHAQPASAGFAS